MALVPVDVSRGVESRHDDSEMGGDVESLKAILLGIAMVVAGLFWVPRLDPDAIARERRRLGLGPQEHLEGARQAGTVFFVLGGAALMLRGFWDVLT